ncbi:MAG: hypothetical protein V5A37_08065 [Halobacteriales archaeon]
MQAGVLGVVDGTFDAVSSFSRTRERNGEALETALEITKVFSLDDGRPAFTGHAVREELSTARELDISYGEIDAAETERTSQRYTQLAGIAGEFVVVDGSRGTFAFDLIEADTSTTVERASIDLDGFLGAQSDPHPWQAGFSGEDGAAHTGVLYGDDLLENENAAALLDRGQLTQLGLDYTYRNTDVKMTATTSGYIEVYRPRSMGDAEFLAYVDDEFLPHCR